MLQSTAWNNDKLGTTPTGKNISQDHLKNRLKSHHVEFKQGRLTVTAQHDDGKTVGWDGISFTVNGQSSTQQTYQSKPSPTPDTQIWQTYYATLQLIETIEVNIDPGQFAVTVKRYLQPKSSCRIDTITDGMLDDQLQLQTWTTNQQLRLAHTNHLRVEHYPRSRAEYPLLRVPAFEQKEYGLGEANDLPMIYLTDEAGQIGLMEVSLAESPLRRIWSVQLHEHMVKTGFARWQASMQPIGSDHFMLPTDCPTLVSATQYRMVENLRPADAFALGADQVAKQYQARGKVSSMRHGSCYCTWNYGINREIDHDALIRRAKIIKANFPSVHHFLMDDGYQKGPRTLDPFYPDPHQNIDLQKFPQGIKAFARELREIGLEPGIWFAPTVNLSSPLAQQNQDWLLRNDQGQPFSMGNEGYLDISVKPARQWLCSVLDMLYGKDRFVGCKLDFQSQMFESDKVRYRSGNGLIWRSWFYQQIRNRIGEDGFFETCIAMSMGNPHLSKWCDGYRVGSDIEDGSWQRHVDSARWTLPVLSIAGNQSLMLNADSFGWNPDESLAVNRHRATWCFITGGLLELGGKLENYPKQAMDMLSRILNNPDRGYACRVVDENAYTGVPLPRVCVIDYPEDSSTAQRGITQHIALFNWTDQTHMVGSTFEALNLKADAKLVDFWDDQPYTSHQHGLFELLGPRESRLLTVLTESR